MLFGQFHFKSFRYFNHCIIFSFNTNLAVYDNKAKHGAGENNHDADNSEKNLRQKSRMDPMGKVEQHFKEKRREHKKHKKQKKEHKKEVSAFIKDYPWIGGKIYIFFEENSCFKLFQVYFSNNVKFINLHWDCLYNFDYKT